MFIALGASVVSIMFYLCESLLSGAFQSFANPYLLLSCLVGCLWSLGIVMFNKSIDDIGLSRCNQWKNLQGVIGAMLCLIFLAEYKTSNYLFIIAAAITILLSATLFTIKKSESEVKFIKRGVMLAASSSLIFGTCGLLEKIVTINNDVISTQQICFSVFAFITMSIFVLAQNKNLSQLAKPFARDNLLGLIAGAIYTSGQLFSIIANKIIPGSVAQTIIQFNGVWTVLIGIFIFKEIDFKSNWLRLSLGIILAVASIFLLMFA
jgi:glucose uptake protein GlcU